MLPTHLIKFSLANVHFDCCFVLTVVLSIGLNIFLSLYKNVSLLLHATMTEPTQANQRLKKGIAEASKADSERNLTVQGVFNTFVRQISNAEACFYSMKPLVGRNILYIGDLLDLNSHNTNNFFACLGIFLQQKNGTWTLSVKNLETYAVQHMLTDFMLVTKFKQYDYHAILVIRQGLRMRLLRPEFQNFGVAKLSFSNHLRKYCSFWPRWP